MSNRYLPLVLLGVIGAVAAEPKRDRYGDPLPEGAIARLGSLRLRHGGSVRVTGFSHDGKTLSAFAGGNSLTCWDTVSGRKAGRVPIGYCSQPRCLRYSPDGKSLILADWPCVIRILDAITGAERIKLEPEKIDPRYKDIRALAVSQDGKTAATIFYKDILVFWDLVGGKRLREVKFHNELSRGSNKPIALTPDGKQLVLPHKDGSLHLLNATSGKEVLAFEMPPNRPQNSPPIVAISANGQYLAYGGESDNTQAGRFNSVTLCDLTTGKRLRELPLKEGFHEWVFAPDSRSLAVSDAKLIRIFDVSSGKETKTLDNLKGGGLVFSPDGRKLAASFGTCLFLWDVVTGKLLHSPIGHDWFIRTIHFYPDGKRLVSNTSGDMIVWDVAASRPVSVYRSGRLQQWFAVANEGDAIRYLDWKYTPLPKGKGKFSLNEKGLEEKQPARPSGTVIQKIHRWDLATDRKEEETVFSTPAACDWFVLSPDGQRVAVVTNGAKPQVTLRDVKRDKPAVKAALPDDSRVVEILFAPDGRRLLVRSWHGAVRVLDGTTGRRVRDLKPDTSGRRIVTTPAFAPDGRSVALFDGQLCIREVASSKLRLSIALKNAPIDLLVSPSGRFLVTSSRNSDDFSIRVFSTATGKLLAHWHGNQSSATALSFSPDSRLLASGGYDGTILLWKLPEDDGLPVKLSQEEAATFWQALADDDAARANRALAGLAAAPAQALPLIKERFRTEWKKPDAKQLARLIADLDADAFKVRERATQELSDAGADAADALRKALANKPSPEVQRRGEMLLKRLNEDGDPERLRSLRAIEILERIGTPQAGELLRELAGKPLPAELHQDIEASLRRMGAKP